MSLFRFVTYFSVLAACAVAAFPAWAPADMGAGASALALSRVEAGANTPDALSLSPSLGKKARPRYHGASPTRMASRD